MRKTRLAEASITFLSSGCKVLRGNRRAERKRRGEAEKKGKVVKRKVIKYSTISQVK